MISEYPITGTRCTTAISCSADGHTFYASVKMPDDRQQALWDYLAGRLTGDEVAVIQHDGRHKDGTPRNPLMIEFKHR